MLYVAEHCVYTIYILALCVNAESKDTTLEARRIT